jgi:hypothetical protein
MNKITLLKYPDRVLVLYGRIKASNIINYVQMLSLNFVNVCKVSKINVKYVTSASAKRDDQNSAKLRVCIIRVYVFAFAATFNTVFLLFSCKPDDFQGRVFPNSIFY